MKPRRPHRRALRRLGALLGCRVVARRVKRPSVCPWAVFGLCGHDSTGPVLSLPLAVGSSRMDAIADATEDALHAAHQRRMWAA
jgi:hypothetical protein